MIQKSEISEFQNVFWDVIIIGAGPAGSSTAITFAKNNIKVLLIDKEKFPREKVCGDCLIGDAQKVLHKFGLFKKVTTKGHKVEKLLVFSPSRHEILLDVPTITIRRKELDYILAKDAVELGAEFISARICNLEEREDHVELIDFKKNRYRAKFVIIATGADLNLIKENGVIQNKTPDTIALRMYYKSDRELDRLVVTYDKSIMPGYGWLFPLGNGVYNIGYGVFSESQNGNRINLKSMLQKFVREFPIARDVSNKGKRIGDIKGARLRCGLETGSAIIGNRILSIGETISTTFNYTGEGIGKAMESGILAGELIGQSLKENSTIHYEYPKILERKYSRLFNGYRNAQKWLSNKFVTDTMIKRMQNSSYLKNTITSVLNNDENPSKIFSVWGLIRSFIS